MLIAGGHEMGWPVRRTADSKLKRANGGGSVNPNGQKTDKNAVRLDWSVEIALMKKDQNTKFCLATHHPRPRLAAFSRGRLHTPPRRAVPRVGLVVAATQRRVSR